MIPLASRLALNLAAAAMVCVPVCAQANTRASDHSTSKSGRVAPPIVPDEDDEEGLVWIIGGIALAAIIAIAVSSGNDSQTRTGSQTTNQSNGAN